MLVDFMKDANRPGLHRAAKPTLNRQAKRTMAGVSTMTLPAYRCRVEASLRSEFDGHLKPATGILARQQHRS